MGEATANLPLQSGHVGKTYMFTGSDVWSDADMGAALSRLTGQNLAYSDIAPALIRRFDQLDEGIRHLCRSGILSDHAMIFGR